MLVFHLNPNNFLLKVAPSTYSSTVLKTSLKRLILTNLSKYIKLKTILIIINKFIIL